jgi:hypothetical protein
MLHCSKCMAAMRKAGLAGARRRADLRCSRRLFRHGRETLRLTEGGFPVATTTIQNVPRRDPGKAALGGIAAGFAAVGRFLCDLSNARKCALEVERLMALPDAELERRGIRRDEIASYAFRNYMHE